MLKAEETRARGKEMNFKNRIEKWLEENLVISSIAIGLGLLVSDSVVKSGSLFLLAPMFLLFGVTVHFARAYAHRDDAVAARQRKR